MHSFLESLQFLGTSNHTALTARSSVLSLKQNISAWHKISGNTRRQWQCTAISNLYTTLTSATCAKNTELGQLVSACEQLFVDVTLMSRPQTSRLNQGHRRRQPSRGACATLEARLFLLISRRTSVDNTKARLILIFRGVPPLDFSLGRRAVRSLRWNRSEERRRGYRRLKIAQTSTSRLFVMNDIRSIDVVCAAGWQ